MITARLDLKFMPEVLSVSFFSGHGVDPIWIIEELTVNKMMLKSFNK